MSSVKSIIASLVIAVFAFNLGYLISANTQDLDSDSSYLDSVFAANSNNVKNDILPNLTFGTSNDTSHWKNNNFDSPKNSKIISGGWVMDSWKHWNNDWLKKFSLNENKEKIPMMYLYTIAGKARTMEGLQDCNVGAKYTLCQNGANFVRKSYQDITKEYQNTANAIKVVYGTSKPILLQMEPDFYQYHNQAGQKNPLTNKEAWDIMNTWTNNIKSILPNARFVMDISPWASDLSTWSAGFTNFSFGGLVGRDYPAVGETKTPDGVWGKTYKQMSQMTGKQLIINTAHGPGGKLLPYQTSWENRNVIQDRVNDGVIAVLQSPNANDRYTKFIDTTIKNPIVRK